MGFPPSITESQPKAEATEIQLRECLVGKKKQKHEKVPENCTTLSSKV